MKEKVNRKRKEKHNCEGTEQLWKNYEKKLDTCNRNYQRTEHYGLRRKPQTDAAGLQVNDKIFVYYTGNLDDGTAQVLRVEKYVSEE